MLYFRDASTDPGIHKGFVEHEELDISDEELARLKRRTRKAVTMDSDSDQTRALPSEYLDFLGQSQGSYSDFLSGKG